MMTLQQPTAVHSQKPNPDLIAEWMLGPVHMAVLKSALKMNIADILTRHNNVQAIANAMNIQADTANLGYFLDAMTAMGLVEKKYGRYTNTAFSKMYLCTDSPAYMGGVVETLSRRRHKNLGRIPELIRHGTPEVKKDDQLDSTEMWTASVGHLVHYQKAGIANEVAGILASLPEFSDMKQMLDMGCGPGIMSIATVSRHPSMRAVLCDLPPVMEIARQQVADAGLEDRITTIEGDYNEVDFGKDYDLIWASQTLYYVRNFDAMFSRIHNVLNPGGVFVSVHEGLTCERTQPADIVLSRFSLALEGQDVSFEQGQIVSYLTNAGFASIETREMTLPMAGPVEFIIARKAS
ncbi:MAG: hypothetical protein CSA22_05220 [Deltaproteobacteria bacterium]|nr:MAG: hypothetical protein CSA22_05220 [Deltaproteobacteria bacterium]